jgi:Flp pilus assembly protein CpaB
MKSRGLVVGVALVLAAAAAAFVILYTNGVKKDAVTGGALSAVIVSKQDIPANSPLDPLITKGEFTSLQVPTDAVVQGAITDVSQLKGQTTTAPIMANEQIPASRLSNGTAPEGGSLGITKGHVALAFDVDGSAGVDGAITAGSYVTVYATFNSPTVKGNSNALTSHQQSTPGLTATLIPAVKVLSIVNPVVDPNTGKAGSGRVTLTLDLLPVDAQNLVYAQQNGSLWFGLLPPGDTSGNPLPFSQVPQNRILGKVAG